MECGFDDDLTILAALVDFAISALFGLIYKVKKNLIAATTIFSHSFEHRAFTL